jgi:hypothetical protein
MLADIINVVQTSMLVTGHLNHLYISLISSNSPLMHPVTEPPPHRGLDFVVANPLVVGIADRVYVFITSPVCVFITAGPSTKMFTWGGGGYGRTCATRDDEPRMGPVRNPVL